MPKYTGFIEYEKLTGYKYRLRRTYKFFMTELINRTITTPFISVLPQGICIVLPGYAWDGPSGPTIDTPSSMRGSLEHDVLYQLMRLGHLPQWFRKHADARLEKTCVEDGMWKWRATWWRRIVHLFAGPAAYPVVCDRRIYFAPRRPEGE